MIRCAECNEENMDGLEYCDSCGAKLEVIATESAEAPAAPDSEAVEEAPAEVEVSAASAARETSETSPEAVAEEPAAEAVGDIPTPAPEEAPGDVAPSEGPGSEGTEGTEGAAGSASLTITRGGTVGKVFELQAGDNLVGRWDPDSGSFPEVDMENDDAEARISRKHALIKFGDELTIEDIGSLNGTFVNRGQRL